MMMISDHNYYPRMVDLRKGCTSTHIILYIFGCGAAISCEHPACYTILHRALHKHSENVKTVQVSSHFGIIPPFIAVLINTGKVVKVVVPRNNEQCLLKEQVNYLETLIKKTTGMECRFRKSVRREAAMSGITVGDGKND